MKNTENIDHTLPHLPPSPGREDAGHLYQKFWGKLKHQDPEKIGVEHGAHEETPPDHGSTYHPAFWGAYKGHVRGLLRGLLVGALAGAIVGCGLALIGPLIPAIAGLHLAAGALIATMTGTGAIIGCELMGKIGNTAGNQASYFAQMEMRARYPSLPEITPGSPAPGIGHHFEVPPDKDVKRPFHWRIALPGIAVGLGIGSLLAFGGGAELLSHAGFEIFEGLHAATAATIGAGGLMGASFGVNRGLFKTLFNYTDSAYDEGRLTGPTADQIARDQARYKVQDVNNPYPITGAQMHDEYSRLLNGYYKKAFTASWSGDRRGLLGGALAGAFSGLAAAGLAIAGGALLLGMSGIAPFVAPIAMFATALGARQGMHIFSDAGRESAAVSVANELYAERIKSLKHGHDISFDEAEKRACSRLTHHPDLNPPGTENKTWFNWKIALIGLVVGALVGVALAPLVAGVVGHIAGVHIVAEGMSLITSLLPLTTATFGLVGMTMGMGDKLMEKTYGVADKIFMGTFFPGHSAKDHISHDYPALGPDSKLYKHGKGKEHVIKIAEENGHDYAAPAHAAMETQPQHQDHHHHVTPKHVQKILDEVQPGASQPVVKASSFAARREQERQQQPMADMAVVRT